MAVDKPIKNMDGVHPGDTLPSSTSRPVIVSNRPFIATDPMLNEADAGEDKPSGEPTAKPQDETGVPATVSRQAKDIVPSGQAVAAQQAEPKEEAAPKTDVPAPATTEMTTDASSEDSEEEDDDEVAASLNPKVQLSAEEEAVAAREAELENLIAAGTYVVPVNKVRKKRAATATVLFLLVIVALVALDVLLDMKILTLGGIPHTNFLGN